MRNREHDDLAELLGAYALHALDADEQIQLESHLAECPRCRAELREHESVATLLGNSGADAPEGVWDQIAATLEEAAPPMRLDLPEGPGSVVPITAARSRRSTRRARPGWILTAAAAALIGVLGLQVVRQDDRIGTLETALERDGMQRAANLALTDPDAVKADLTSLDGSLHASAVVLPNGTGYLLAHEMPGLTSDRTYQLWGQTEGGLVSLGLLGARPNEVVVFQASAAVTALAVTDEDAPGVAQSSNPPVMSGRFD